MCSIRIMGVVHLKVSWPMKMSKKTRIAGVPTRSADKNSGKLRGSRVWNLRLALGQEMQTDTRREIEWAAAKEAPSVFVAAENTPEEYGPWQWARPFGGATGRFGAESFTLQDNGMLRCEAGSKSEPRAKCVKKTPLRSGPSMWPPRWIVRTVNCGDNAWVEEPKATVLVGEVGCAVSYLVLRLWSTILLFWEPSAGWM
jgi:hypothetical protein